MMEDVVGGAIEVAVDTIATGISPQDAPKRYRKGCWWLTIIILAVAVITVIVIAYNS